MKRRFFSSIGFVPLLLLFALLFVLFSLPKRGQDRLRGGVTSTLTPVWKLASFVSGASSEEQQEKRERDLGVQKLQVENLRLKRELRRSLETIVQLRSLLREESSLEAQESMQKLLSEGEERRAKILTSGLACLPASVVFRDPAAWSSYLWVDVGEDDNREFGRKVVEKNSPVVLGTSLLGLVDYVGSSYSRVRLITDAGLNPAVRVVRGKWQNNRLLLDLEAIQEKLAVRRDLFPEAQGLEEVKRDVSILRSYLEQAGGTAFLSKGFVYGSSEPLWRSKRLLLRGEGFNYDFSDAWGEARDLRGMDQERTGTLVQEGDLLLTSGFDGVFPPGLHVGHVRKVLPLQEGEIGFDLEILPEVQSFVDVETVFILPPYQEGLLDEIELYEEGASS